MDTPGVAAGLAISGIFDLEPIRLSYLNKPIGMDAATARAVSPIHHLPPSAPPLAITVGDAELPELVRQSEDYAKAWISPTRPGVVLPAPGHNHFTILEEVAKADGSLLTGLLKLV
jgi:arylformamidase